MDTTTITQKVKDLQNEQEAIQLGIINNTHSIEVLQQSLKFSNKRLKAVEQEIEFYEGLNKGNGD